MECALRNLRANTETSKLPKFGDNNLFVFKAHLAIRGVVNYYSASVATHDHRIVRWGWGGRNFFLPKIMADRNAS
jgi:hypothetical protein